MFVKTRHHHEKKKLVVRKKEGKRFLRLNVCAKDVPRPLKRACICTSDE